MPLFMRVHFLVYIARSEVIGYILVSRSKLKKEKRILRTRGCLFLNAMIKHYRFYKQGMSLACSSATSKPRR